jgi:hypothetical protein
MMALVTSRGHWEAKAPVQQWDADISDSPTNSERAEQIIFLKLEAVKI